MKKILYLFTFPLLIFAQTQHFDAKIFVAGHRGLVGNAIVSELKNQGYTNIITRTSKELDLTNQAQTKAFFDNEKALLDGLRMPNTKNEIRDEKPKKGEKIFHCLMEDDGIVRKINIEHQKLLFDTPNKKRNDKEVFVLIEANILPKFT